MRVVQNEKLVKEEGDMVHISTMLSRMAAVCRISTNDGCGSGFLTAVTRGGTLRPFPCDLSSQNSPLTHRHSHSFNGLTDQSFVCVMTNNHVISTQTQALASVAEFFDLNDPLKGTRVSLQPYALFLTVLTFVTESGRCMASHLGGARTLVWTSRWSRAIAAPYPAG